MDAHVRLVAARIAAEEGRFEDALREHVWFHEHGLEQDPSVYGVRLSSALRDWIALGRQYPEALRALREIRDRKSQELLSGVQRRELFDDVASIDEHLGERAHTHSLFRGIARIAPGFARRCGDLAFASVVAARDYRLAAKILPRIDWIAGCFQESCAHLREPGASAHDDHLRRIAVDLFVDEVRQVLTVLRAVDRPEEAALTRQRALDLVEDEVLREMVRERLSAHDTPARTADAVE